MCVASVGARHATGRAARVSGGVCALRSAVVLVSDVAFGFAARSRVPRQHSAHWRAGVLAPARPHTHMLMVKVIACTAPIRHTVPHVIR